MDWTTLDWNIWTTFDPQIMQFWSLWTTTRSIKLVYSFCVESLLKNVLYMEFNFKVTTMDSQEPTCTDNSYQTLNEVGVNSYLIRCVTEVPNSTEDGSTTLCFTDQVISSCPIAAMSLCSNTTTSQTIPQVERGVTALWHHSLKQSSLKYLLCKR